MAVACQAPRIRVITLDQPHTMEVSVIAQF
jgi:hypothetical protein